MNIAIGFKVLGWQPVSLNVDLDLSGVFEERPATPGYPPAGMTIRPVHPLRPKVRRFVEGLVKGTSNVWVKGMTA